MWRVGLLTFWGTWMSPSSRRVTEQQSDSDICSSRSQGSGESYVLVGEYVAKLGSTGCISPLPHDCPMNITAKPQNSPHK